MKKALLVFKLGGFNGHYDSLGRHLWELKAELKDSFIWVVYWQGEVEFLRADLKRFMHPADEVTIFELAA